MRTNTNWEKVGEIGVDAGLCWVGDPCYILHKDKLPEPLGKDWGDFVDKLYSKSGPSGAYPFNYELGHAGLGVAVSTGYGDGCYPVYIKRNAEGRVACVMVRFCR